jgi:hypothetical protein
MAKTKVKKGKASFKGILFLLLIAGVIAGVVCAVVFWPKRPSEIKNQVAEQINFVLSEDDENSFFANYTDFSEYANSFFEADGNNDKNLHKKSIDNIINVLDKYFAYINYNLAFADFSIYDQIAIQNARINLNNAKISSNNIAIFLKDKNSSLTTENGDSRKYANSDAELVWLGIKNDLQDMIKYYHLATENLASIYAKNVNKGIYANEFANKTVESVGYYLNYFAQNYENANTLSYYNMSIKFKLFSKYFNIVDGGYCFNKYYSSMNIQNNTTVVCNFDKQFEDYTLKQFVLDEMNYSGKDFTVEQIGYAEGAIIFLTGGFVL